MPSIRKRFSSFNISNVKILVFDDLNHLMISGEGKSTPVEYMKKGHVDKRVIDEIARWMVK